MSRSTAGARNPAREGDRVRVLDAGDRLAGEPGHLAEA
jgi:hypothetical protein